ncbi:MAG TPA: biopolymer transporter ExbD [Cytophagaceae bacterium]|jgi:biopolymer transport protein ExbD|nr:biopolymer transporter ExbD [Cytophagaceae bacterium]
MSGKRGGISLDMTAMCDMAFLLLTFFILTAKMKTPEVVQVDIPASVSDKKIQEQGLLKITVSKEGAVFFSLSEASTRKDLIERVNELKKLNLTEKDKIAFANTEMFGLPFNQMKGFFSMPASKREKYPQQGIPIDSANNELKVWIKEAKGVNNRLIIAIKGDKESDYEKYSGVVSTLQDLNLNKFSLITSLQAKPKDE